jgi:hypothetical protein
MTSGGSPGKELLRAKSVESLKIVNTAVRAPEFLAYEAADGGEHPDRVPDDLRPHRCSNVEIGHAQPELDPVARCANGAAVHALWTSRIETRRLSLPAGLGTTEPRDRAAHNLCGGGRRIDHLPHFSDLRGRKAADLSVLPDDGLILGEINAKSLIVSDIALDPLNVRTEPV